MTSSDNLSQRTNRDSPWQDPEILEELYWDEGMTIAEVADELGCSDTTVARWMEKNGIERRDNGIPDYDDAPWRDEEFLREQYWEKRKTIPKIAEELECGVTTVRDWMVKHGIERRDWSEAIKAGYPDHAHYFMNHNGHMRWRHFEDSIFVHQLLAISEYGFEEVAEKQVHHKNHIPWDNRPENIELMTMAEHTAHHSRKITGIDRLRVAELYEHGDIVSRPLGEMFGISNATVLGIHKEFYGGEA